MWDWLLVPPAKTFQTCALQSWLNPTGPVLAQGTEQGLQQSHSGCRGSARACSRWEQQCPCHSGSQLLCGKARMTAPEKHLCQGCWCMNTGMRSAGADLALQPKSIPLSPVPARHVKAQCGFLTTCPGYCETAGAEGTSCNDLPCNPLVPFYGTLTILLLPLLGTHSQTASCMPASFTLVSTPSTQAPLALLTFPLKIFCLFEGPCQLLLSLTLRRCSSICSFLPFLCVSLISHLSSCCPGSSV